MIILRIPNAIVTPSRIEGISMVSIATVPGMEIFVRNEWIDCVGSAPMSDADLFARINAALEEYERQKPYPADSQGTHDVETPPRIRSPKGHFRRSIGWR
jgi:hypothetical protein